MLNISKKKIQFGFSIIELLMSFILFSIVFLIFFQIIVSVRDIGKKTDNQLRLRGISFQVQNNLNTQLRNAFFLFSKDNVDVNNSILPAPVSNNSIISNFNSLPGGSIDDAPGEPGNSLYYLEQEILPLNEIVDTIGLSNTSSLSLNARNIVQNIGIPSAVQNCRVRVLYLNLIYLKPETNPNNFEKGALNLIHSVGNYDIYHKSTSTSGIQGSIVWPENFVVSLTQDNISSVIPMNQPDSISRVSLVLKEIVDAILDENGFYPWEKPEEGDLTILPVPSVNSSFTSRVIGKNIGFKDRISLSPFSTQFMTIPTGQNATEYLKEIDSLKEIFGLTFQYSREKFEESSSSAELGNERLSQVIKVILHLSSYETNTKKYMSTKSYFKSVPRNMRQNF